jgi:hypothetical protein
MDYRPKCHSKIYKTFGRKPRKNNCDFGLGKDLLDKKAMPNLLKKVTDKLECIKI